MAGGYMGRTLLVDLSTGHMEERSPQEGLLRDFIGGYGLGARLIYEWQKPGVDPLGPDNILGFATGPLTGTPAIVGSRYTVVGKSPLTGAWGDANSGGFFGPRLKFAGYDAVYFRGIAEKPVYLFLDEGRAELRDASSLWGVDAYQAEDQLKKELGKGTEVACIGPAGEKLSLIACIVNNRGRAAARCGLGALMGSKRLKAVVARGNLEVPLADKEKTGQLSRKYRKDMSGRLFESFSKFGTCVGVAANAMRGDSPVRNWTGVGIIDFPNAEAVSDANVIKYEVKKYACYRCPLGCGGLMEVPAGPYPVERGSKKPEYETLAAFGSLCLNDNVESIIKLNDLCGRYGLDTISTGASVAFAMECYEKGLITKKDTDGLELSWGNHAAIVAMVEKLARREGFGDLLADGVRLAAQRIGHGAEEFAIHIQGQEIAMHDPKLFPAYATAYQAAGAPGRHTEGGGYLQENYGGFRGLEVPPHDRYAYSGKAQMHKKLASFNHVINSAGLCLFTSICTNANALPDFLGAVTGWHYGMEGVLEAGERIATMRMAFNVREGLNPVAWQLPGRVLGKPPLKDGPTAGIQVDNDTQVREFLEEMGWDPRSGKPTREKLRQLGLDDVAADLWP
jgi:aldehyde:ferredoxin oxidoreductase